MNKLRTLILELGHQFEAEDNAASDLWTWLPSHAVAEKHHGSQAVNVQPTIKDIMREASIYFAHQKYRAGQPYTEEEREWFEECPCGESHVPEEDESGA